MSVIDEVGELPGFGTVWVHRKGIANVLSFKGVKDTAGYQIQYDNFVEDAFNVTKPNGEVRKFIPSKKGLYYCDCSHMFEQQTGTQVQSDHNNNRTGNEVPFDRVKPNGKTVRFDKDINKPIMHGTVLGIETITKNKSLFTKRDVKRAEKARRLQHIAAHLSHKQLLSITQKNQLKNCPIVPRDIRLMDAILGPSVPGLKGKTVRRNKPAVEPNIIPIPQHIRDYYQDVTLAIDIMHVNKIPFLMTISRSIHYGTASVLASMKLSNVLAILQDLKKHYRQRDFNISYILADGQFKPM